MAVQQRIIPIKPFARRALGTGGGFADYAIRLGIDPFDDGFDDDTRILFYWSSTGHDAGGESVFVSGNAGDNDFDPPIPEPATLLLLGTGLAACLLRKRRGR